MPSRRDDIEIDEAGLWDVVEWDHVAKLAATAPSDKYGLIGRQDLAVPWLAKCLVDEGAKSDNLARLKLQALAGAWLRGHSSEQDRRIAAGELGVKLGADPERFIELLTKYGLFRR